MVNQNDGSKKAQTFSSEKKLEGLEQADNVYSTGRCHIFWSRSVLHTPVKGQNIIFRKLVEMKKLKYWINCVLILSIVES